MPNLKKYMPAFIAAVLGVLFVWLLLRTWWFPVPVAALGLLIGYVSDKQGRHLLPDHPVGAARLMELWILVPIVMAAAGGAVLVFVGVIVAEREETWTIETKELVTAGFAAISGLVTSALIKSADDPDQSWIAERIRVAFRNSYGRKCTEHPEKPNKRYFEEGSNGERWVYSDPFNGVQGWGHSARLARARGVKEALKQQAQTPRG